MQWIIDGNNLMYRIPALRELLRTDAESARQRLLSLFPALIGADGVDEIMVVFDGRGQKVASLNPSPGLTVLYSSDCLSADAVIERLVLSASAPARCIVVSSDRMERDTAHAAGAETMGCGDFLDWLEGRRRQLSLSLSQRRRADIHPKLGELFPLQ